jgi:hypothetical protein
MDLMNIIEEQEKAANLAVKSGVLAVLNIHPQTTTQIQDELFLNAFIHPNDTSIALEELMLEKRIRLVDFGNAKLWFLSLGQGHGTLTLEKPIEIAQREPNAHEVRAPVIPVLKTFKPVKEWQEHRESAKATIEAQKTEVKAQENGVSVATQMKWQDWKKAIDHGAKDYAVKTKLQKPTTTKRPKL